MKQIFILFAVTLLFIGCGKKEEANIDDLIKSKDLVAIKAKRDLIQADLAKLETAVATLDIKKVEEALVSVLTVKDTIFSHYLEVQGSVNTNQNILIQPEMPGTLVALNVKAGQRVSAGQILGRTDDAGMSQQLAAMKTNTIWQKQHSNVKKIFGIKKLDQKFSFCKHNRKW